MKKLIGILILVIGWQGASYAQSYEAQQLLLDVEKLTQFKQILADMKSGYDILVKGYTTIRDISEGSFNLHNAFLNALWIVSPAVRNYKRITDIITMQVRLTEQYKQAFSQFKASGQFSDAEINYLSGVYDRLFNESINNLDDLGTILTDGKTRMSDQERLAAIDRLYKEISDESIFLNDFNAKTYTLALARAKESNDAKIVQQLY